MKTASVTLLVAAAAGCAHEPRARFLGGVAIGGTAGVASGALLSPNEESRGLNALVFGLGGALVGGLLGLLLHDDSEVPAGEKKTAKNGAAPGVEYMVPPRTDLPTFVRERLKPVVVEEIVESDTVSEDGTLHEPHKVYRIKQPGELIAKPIQKNESKVDAK